MTISVIIPIYNVQKYVRRCLESVIAQECEKFDIECLIIDDCSPDDSMTIVNEVINSYQGSSITFKTIRHEQNMGLSMARNTGIKAATGDFIYFIDSDDHIMENTFKSFVSQFVSYPFVDVIVGNSLGIEDNYLSNTWAPSFVSSLSYIDDKRKLIEMVLRRKIDRHAWNKLVKRSLFVENDLFFDAGLLYEDVTWSYKLYSCASSVLIVPGLTYLYEYNPSSIVHTHADRASKMVWSFTFICDKVLKNCPVVNGKQVLFSAHRLFVFHWFLQAMTLNEKFGADQETVKTLKSIKRTLMKDAICHFRPFMALYFLIMFTPFNSLLKSRMFRSNLDRINKIVYKLS